MTTLEIIKFYDEHAKKLSAIYEEIPFEKIFGDVIPILPKPCTTLDIGSGSGRDAAWLSRKGYKVTAIEPSTEMYSLAKETHPEDITWINDSLPKLETQRNKKSFYGLILISAVWMHIKPSDREESFQRVDQLIKPGGVLIITLRHGTPSQNRIMFDASSSEIENYKKKYGYDLKFTSTSKDQLNRADVHWETIALVKR